MSNVNPNFNINHSINNQLPINKQIENYKITNDFYLSKPIDNQLNDIYGQKKQSIKNVNPLCSSTSIYNSLNNSQASSLRVSTLSSLPKLKILDEKYIAASTSNGNLVVWNYLNGMLYKIINLDNNYDFREIVFDSMLIINEFYLIILLSNGVFCVYDIRNDSKAEIYYLNIGPCYGFLRITDSYFAIGLESKFITWAFQSPTIDKIIQNANIKGKIFYLEKYNMKINNLRILTGDEKSFKLWNQQNFSLIMEIDYPQANLFQNLNLEQKNLLSFDKILTILKIADDKTIIFNQTLNNISLLDLEIGESINDGKTFEKKVVDICNIHSKRIFSSDMFGNLVSYFDGVATLWELDNNQNIYLKDSKVNDSISSYYSNYESLYGKTFLKKIEEIKLGINNITDMKFLHSISFVTINNEFKVSFWDFHK